jgi:thioredoxin-related protein
MKQLFLLLAACPLLLQAQTGIQFESGKSWTQIKEAAKKSNKLIFLDAYASWCGPCKAMARDVFTKSTVGNYYNAQFINAKIDMEQGEGVQLAKRYNVSAYPTLFFIDGDGNMVHKVLGYKDVDQLLQAGRNANDPSKQFSSLMKKYNQGTLPESQYMTLIEAMEEAGENEACATLVSKVLGKNKNWLQEPQLGLVYRFTQDANGEQYRFLANNEATIAAIPGYEGIAEKLDQLVTAQVIQETLSEETQQLDEAKAKRRFQELRPATGNASFAKLMWRYAEFKKESAIHVRAAKAIGAAKSNFDWQYLNEIAWKIYDEMRANKALLEEALPIGMESVKKESNYYNNDTVAHILAELGKKKDAKKYAQTAIELGKKTGEDVSSTKQLLNSL